MTADSATFRGEGSGLPCARKVRPVKRRGPNRKRNGDTKERPDGYKKTRYSADDLRRDLLQGREHHRFYDRSWTVA